MAKLGLLYLIDPNGLLPPSSRSTHVQMRAVRHLGAFDAQTSRSGALGYATYIYIA